MKRYLSRSTLIAAVIAYSLVLHACNTPKLVKLAERASSISAKLKPVIAPLIASGQLPANLTARVDQFHDVTIKLADAFRNQTGDAVELTATAIHLVETFINEDFVKIKDPGTRTFALAILAAADIALGEISDALSNGAAQQPAAARAARAAQPSAAITIAAFAKKPRLRCRDAKTGRFAKMDQCLQSPQTTVVERAN